MKFFFSKTLPRSPSFLHKNVPYYSQWESKKLIKRIITESFPSEKDPLWKKSGAKTPDEYAFWSKNMCGMACLKSVLSYLHKKEIPTITLGIICERYGGYEVKKDQIDGLFYEPFVTFIKNEFGLQGEVKKRLSVKDIIKQLSLGNFVIASVTPLLRDQNSRPFRKGGHLILMLGYDLRKKQFIFHNPSGFYNESQENVKISFDDFKNFFAGRGIAITTKPPATMEWE